MLNAETSTEEQTEQHAATTPLVRADQTTYDSNWWDDLTTVGPRERGQQGIGSGSTIDTGGQSPNWRRDSIGLDRRSSQNGIEGLRSDVVTCNCCWCHNMNHLGDLLGLTPNQLELMLIRLLRDEIRRSEDWRRNSDGFWG